MPKITPVLLCGGAGARLWPSSRRACPKPFLALHGPETMLQQTARRVCDRALFKPMIVMASAEHRFTVAEQLRTIGVQAKRIILEPQGRNTAPAVATAAILAAHEDPEALILALPADHVIGDIEAFHEAVAAGQAATWQGRFVLFGVPPQRPETGYGYIRIGEPLPGAPGVRRVLRFTEKPDEAMAACYLADGDRLWNSGIFLLPAGAFLAELRRLEPGLVHACERAVARAIADADFLRLDPNAFVEAPSLSIDRAVMERTKAAAVVPVEMGWSDVGAWSAVWNVEAKDEAGNATSGDTILAGTRNCYVRSEGPLVAALGIEDLVIVATPDAVLVMPRSRDQAVKTLVERLERIGRSGAT